MSSVPILHHRKPWIRTLPYETLRSGMEHLREDLRDSGRYIRRAGGSSALIVLLLALGIGLTVTGFGRRQRASAAAASRA